MESINLILFLVFCGITTVALLIVLNLLLPAQVERAREKLESRPVRCLVIGLVGLGLSFAILLLLHEECGLSGCRLCKPWQSRI